MVFASLRFVSDPSLVPARPPPSSSRQFTAILAGCIVGLMGWTGLAGFLAYLEICVVVSLYLAYRLNVCLAIAGLNDPRFRMRFPAAPNLTLKHFWAFFFRDSLPQREGCR